MASITIRNLDEDVKNRLRVRAASNGRSMEEEVRVILGEAVTRDSEPENLASFIRECFRAHWRRGTRTAAARTDARASRFQVTVEW